MHWVVEGKHLIFCFWLLEEMASIIGRASGVNVSMFLCGVLQVFHDVAYHAHNREDLLAGIDEFLDQVMCTAAV